MDKTGDRITASQESRMKKKILIVDDHADFRSAVIKHLKMSAVGVEVFEAGTGEMGVAKASCVKPDIVLMDINLPNITGLEAARQIKEDHPDCDIIILTIFDVAVFKKAAEKVRVRAFIGKNEVYERLLPAIQECFRGGKIRA
ncbi:MAG: response regulator transcription factor [Candidatus Omnitrophica bacterium]|nr:response regulator transcription factor [Candidatus Omnitrophota bacterium]